jgi:hypothetical protein
MKTSPQNEETTTQEIDIEDNDRKKMGGKRK